MTYVVFTHDELPIHKDADGNYVWPEHEHQDGSHSIKAQPVQGVFAVEDRAGNVSAKCDEGYGFIYLNSDGELRFLTLSQFESQYKGAEHVRGALELEAKIAELRAAYEQSQ